MTAGGVLAGPIGAGIAPIRRAVAALLLIAAIGAVAAWLAWRPAAPDLPRGGTPYRALSAVAAAERQNVYPTTHGEALARIDATLTADLARVGPGGGGWLGHGTIAGDYLDRARLTGSFDDYARAGRSFETAFQVAEPGFGPHLERAAYNMATHRLDAVEPDLVRIEHYALPPDDITRATILGMRGDLLFYRGRYAEALDLYQQSRRLGPAMGPSLRLATYWAAMGEPDRALGFLDEAQYYVTGAQQQVLAGIEMQRGAIAFGRGRWDEAQRHYTRAADIFPGNWNIEEHIALLAALRGDRSQAAAMFARVASRDASPEAMDALAGLARADGDFSRSQGWAARAEAEWRRRMALLPTAAYGHALEHLLAFGSPAETLRVALAAYRARPFGESATQLASAYLANRQPADALRIIEPVLASGWTSSDAHLVAMEASALSGDGQRADAERRKALAINPHALDRNPAMVWLGH
jgi:tetratricopeptide (TPR) repeat protein